MPPGIMENGGWHIEMAYGLATIGCRFSQAEKDIHSLKVYENLRTALELAFPEEVDALRKKSGVSSVEAECIGLEVTGITLSLNRGFSLLDLSMAVLLGALVMAAGLYIGGL